MDLMYVEFLRPMQALQCRKAIHRHTRGTGDKGKEEGFVLGVEGLEDLCVCVCVCVCECGGWGGSG